MSLHAQPDRTAEADPDWPIPPLERLTLLCDEGSLNLVRSEAAGVAGGRVQPGDGVLGGHGRIGGRPVACFAQDARFAGGSVGRQHADTIVRVQRMAERGRMPIVGFVESGGARVDEGVAALDGYARIFAGNVALSGQVPQLTVVTGTSAGGGCYSPALTDFVVMTRRASMFLTGPRVVREVTGEETTTEELGGTRVHGRNGVSHFVVDSDVDAVFLVRRLIGYLPQHAGAPLPAYPPAAPDGPNPEACVPADRRRPYDVRDLARAILDAASLVEVAPHWAPNLVTAVARLEGRPVGVVANQPRRLGGALDAQAAQKGARFVRTCDAFGIPLVVLVDTPGFLPGTRQEGQGVIRHGAELVRAFAEATVPSVTVVVRKAFGGGYIAMNSKELGADLALAWPDAELGIMGAQQAVGVGWRRKLAAVDDPVRARDDLAARYAAQHLGARSAARQGCIDEVVHPSDTRARVAGTLDALG